MPEQDVAAEPTEEQEVKTALEGAPRRTVFVLLASVCLIATCSIVYELIVATISSYLLGNSVYQFSITIGLFMSSMGLGSFASRAFKRNLIDSFILVEITIGLVGGLSAAALFYVYGAADRDLAYLSTMFGLIVAIGTMIGLEIPILTRILKQYGTLRVTISNVLAFDYAGALVGSIAFPLLLLKTFGLVQTAFVMGLLNVAVAGAVLVQFWPDVGRRIALTSCVLLSGGILLGGTAAGRRVDAWLERQLYSDRIVLSKQSEYQRIIMTRVDPVATADDPDPGMDEPRVMAVRRGNDLRLFIDGEIQFSSVDEYRYHEALVHPALSLAQQRAAVLILGGGDGLAAREILKYPEVEKIVLVDIDPEITRLCSTNAEVAALNQGALTHPKVTIVNWDAYKFVEQTTDKFDAIIIDLPDPNHESLSKLYAVEFYKLARQVLSPGGLLVQQSTSPFFARHAFWCIHHSLEAAGFEVAAYHLNVPSLADWGFNLASASPIDTSKIRLRVDTAYLTDAYIPAMFLFGKDVAETKTKLNTLFRPALMSYYDDDRWAYY